MDGCSNSSSNSTEKIGFWPNHRSPADGIEGKWPAFHRTLPSARAHYTLQGECVCEKNTPLKNQITRGTRVWWIKKILVSREENTDFMQNSATELTHFCRTKSRAIDFVLQKCVSSVAEFSIKSVFSFRDISIFWPITPSSLLWFGFLAECFFTNTLALKGIVC